MRETLRQSWVARPSAHGDFAWRVGVPNLLPGGILPCSLLPLSLLLLASSALAQQPKPASNQAPSNQAPSNHAASNHGDIDHAAIAVSQKYCVNCHQGKTASGGVDLSRPEQLASRPGQWNRAVVRLRDHSMPPKSMPAPSLEERERLANWIAGGVKSVACADGVQPAPYRLRRLNRSEYSATVRDLLNIHISAGHALPADGAGGEGFDNAAETLFLSPIHAEKYLDAAKQALEYALRDPKSTAAFLIAKPKEGVTEEQAARQVLERFLPRAFRRPLRPGELEKYERLFAAAKKRGERYEGAIRHALQGALLSPHFLFRLETPNPTATPAPADSYALASRLSYFLWGTMPDDKLFQLAASGELQKPEVLKAEAVRLLKDPKAIEFAERFVEQWLGTRELGRDIKPDPKLFATYYDQEIQSAIKYEPIIFFQEVLAQNLSLLTLLDANFTILTSKLQKHYGLPPEGKLRQQPVRVELPPNSHRGGLLSMAAVLAVSSLPQRTSPVLRGKWVLDALLGTPPPPPPPNVPELKEEAAGQAPQTLRERLERHREKAACSSCHSRIDPLGFGLENYDVLGRWRETEAGKPVDAKGTLPDGRTFTGPEELKKVLLERKELFLTNLTSKLLGYALGRGLTAEDACAVDGIVKTLADREFKAHTLVEEIVTSVPFRMQAPAPAGPKP